MAQVTVTIDGKQYRMACDEGQEEHLIDLASRFDRYVAHLKENFGEIGDLRLTVMAGIMVTDELSELQRRLKSLEDENSTLHNGHSELAEDIEQDRKKLVDGLNEASQRIEAIAESITASIRRQ